MKNWFYTIVINYSLYAYNFRDYIYEKTCAEKIETLRDQMDDVPHEEDYYWLKGVFHKNDGYQTPIVVNPMRQNGYINAQKENQTYRPLLRYSCFTVKKSGGVSLRGAARTIFIEVFPELFYAWKRSRRTPINAYSIFARTS